LDAQLQPVHDILFIESSPQPTKWALHEMGMVGPGIRMPLIELSEAHRPELRVRLQAIGALA
jgi:4-hydroxy-tetrahydrodipicolinate synthase